MSGPVSCLAIVPKNGASFVKAGDVYRVLVDGKQVGLLEGIDTDFFEIRPVYEAEAVK